MGIALYFQLLYCTIQRTEVTKTLHPRERIDEFCGHKSLSCIIMGSMSRNNGPAVALATGLGQGSIHEENEVGWFDFFTTEMNKTYF